MCSDGNATRRRAKISELKANNLNGLRMAFGESGQQDAILALQAGTRILSRMLRTAFGILVIV
jgi:hypothetical protein